MSRIWFRSSHRALYQNIQDGSIYPLCIYICFLCATVSYLGPLSRTDLKRLRTPPVESGSSSGSWQCPSMVAIVFFTSHRPHHCGLRAAAILPPWTPYCIVFALHSVGRPRPPQWHSVHGHVYLCEAFLVFTFFFCGRLENSSTHWKARWKARCKWYRTDSAYLIGHLGCYDCKQACCMIHLMHDSLDEMRSLKRKEKSSLIST